MADTTGIAWTDSTFNPWIGCQRVSPGCELCYAEVQDSRKRWEGRTHWGPTAARYRTSGSNWNKPLTWNRAAAKLQKRHLVFCASLADVFEDRAELSAWRADLFRLIEATPALTWLVLTKRPENILGMIPDRWRDVFPEQVWLGTTVEDQKRKTRIDTLRDAAAQLRTARTLARPVSWLSIEPLIEDLGALDLAAIDWAIVGGESDFGAGARARPFDLAWARAIRLQCRVQSVAYFFKQKGSNVVDRGQPVTCVGKGDDPAVWPESISGREFPRMAA